MFNLTRLAGSNTTFLMEEWTSTNAILNNGEKYLFDHISKDILSKIVGGNEEMLKMNFIADCTKKVDLLQIIAILRKFKEILETRLL